MRAFKSSPTGVDGRVALLPLLWQTISVTHLEIGNVVIHVLPHMSQPGDTWEPHIPRRPAQYRGGTPA